MMFRRPAEYNYYLHHLLWGISLPSRTVVLACLFHNELYNELLIVRCQFVFEVANYVNLCLPNLNALTN
jgi:hypothetical protein